MTTPIDEYLDQVAAFLPGPRRRRNDVLSELRDGLRDAADGHGGVTGPPSKAAMTAAVKEFGDPRQLAKAFCPHLAAAQARRLLLVLSLSAPLIMLLWMYAAAASDATGQGSLSWHSLTAPPVPIAAAALGIAAIAGTAIFLTQQLLRTSTGHAKLEPVSAAIAGFSIAGADLFILALLGEQILVAHPGRLSFMPVAGAAILTVGRLTISHKEARACIRAARS